MMSWYNVTCFLSFERSCRSYCKQMESMRWGGVGGGVAAVDGSADSDDVSTGSVSTTSISGGARLCGISDAASV